MTYEQRVRLIKKSLTLLLRGRSVVELRAPKAEGGPLLGLFDDYDQAAAAAAKLSGKVPGIYESLNAITQSVARRVENRLAEKSSGIRDTEIERRLWLPIDFDPVRPSNVPSTNLEHRAALQVAEDCQTWLGDLGFPEPVSADSGNGAHLLYPIDFPNDNPSSELIEKVLEVISLRFSNSEVLVDTGNFNASRVWRVYGTLNQKGEETKDRRYRRARMRSVPSRLVAVSAEQLRKVTSLMPRATTAAGESRFDVAGWIAGNNVPVLESAAWKGTGRKWILQCPFNSNHQNRSAYIVQFADGGVAAGCLHASCAGNDWPKLRAIYESDAPKRKAESDDQPENFGTARKTSETSVLLDLASARVQFFCTPQGQAYGTIPVGNHSENHPLEGRALKQWLRHQYFLRTKTVPKAHSMQEALSHFDAVARYESQVEPVFLRVAEKASENYIDLADERWRVVEINANGWRITNNAPVKFRRSPGMLPLPAPLDGGNINDLKKFLNFRTEDDWILFLTVLLEALLQRSTYPVLGLHGEAGSAKTTTSRIMRAIIDPNVSLARAMPKDARDLMILAHNCWLLVFDNLSFVPTWFSDYLCRFSTGGGFATRQLYTDMDEIVFDGQRPVILNGVEELASRTDLLDRSIVLDLPVIRNYKPEREFWPEFDSARARLLGALLNVAVDALRQLPKVRLTNSPRLADFALLATAAESKIGISEGSFMRAYVQNRQTANAVALEASPIASSVCDLAEEGPWSGTAADLLQKLVGMNDDEMVRRRAWPKNAKVLSGMLRRLATALRRAGVEVEFWRDKTQRRTRMISIRRRSRQR